MRKTTSGMTLLLGCLNSLHCVQIAGAVEVGPVTPVEDRIFIIDSSGSISPSDFSIELAIIREFTCGPNAPDPSTTPFGVQVIRFADSATVVISYRVISTITEAQEFCNLLTFTAPGGATKLTLALDTAINSFQTTTLAADRHLFVLTDGGMQNPLGALNSAMTLRTMVPPVQICVTNVSDDCFNSDILQEIANSELSPMHVPTEPTGLYGCTVRLGFPNIFCVDCACAADCNANGIFDAIDLSDGTSIDANGDLLPDECVDCDNNLIFDAQDIAADPAQDCNVNGILDACELAVRSSLDCNSNFIPDECDISSSFSRDCNVNGIPDECELEGQVSIESPQLSPIGLGFPVSHTFISPLEALGDVTMRFSAIADLDSVFLALDVYLNDVFQGRIFRNTGSFCPETPDEEELVVLMADFNTLVNGGDAVIRIETFDSVEFDACDGSSWVNVAMNYIAPPIVPDVNANGIIDSCDLARGDFNLDGVVNVTDLLSLLGAWGLCPGCPQDTNLDGSVNVTDLLTLLANWG